MHQELSELGNLVEKENQCRHLVKHAEAKKEVNLSKQVSGALRMKPNENLAFNAPPDCDFTS